MVILVKLKVIDLVKSGARYKIFGYPANIRPIFSGFYSDFFVSVGINLFRGVECILFGLFSHSLNALFYALLLSMVEIVVFSGYI